MKRIYHRGVLIAFGELFLKSKGVKNFFQKRLVQNLRFFLWRKPGILSFRERIFITLLSAALSDSEKRRRETGEISKSLKIIKDIFGIAWFGECLYFPKTDLKEFSRFINKNYENWLRKNETFALRIKMEKGIIKEDKDKVIKTVAKNIKRKVDLSSPKKEIFIEIRKNGWFLYFQKKKGAGGLPSGVSGKVLSLVSGGIDSPVSSYLVAKRGAENIWLHFHSFPLVSRASIEKIEELAAVFLKYQPRLKVYFIPFSKAQLEIKTKSPANYRVILYRRLMFKIAEKIAEKEGCYALITGESLGQVSSQTLANIKIIESAIKIPVLRPLIGQDKEEITVLAKKTGTYNISLKPQEDCCTLFVSKHQTGRGDIKLTKELERKIDIKKIIKECLRKAEIRQF